MILSKNKIYNYLKINIENTQTQNKNPLKIRQGVESG
jgi:hypothetical protein